MEQAETIAIDALEAWRAWLKSYGGERDQVWVEIYKKSSGKQLVTFDDLLEEALCWGWVDTQTKGVNDERYRIRFRRRRPGSNWSAINRVIVCRLLASDRMQPAGRSVLPADLTCPD